MVCIFLTVFLSEWKLWILMKFINFSFMVSVSDVFWNFVKVAKIFFVFLYKLYIFLDLCIKNNTFQIFFFFFHVYGYLLFKQHFLRRFFSPVNFFGTYFWTIHPSISFKTPIPINILDNCNFLSVQTGIVNFATVKFI